MNNNIYQKTLNKIETIMYALTHHDLPAHYKKRLNTELIELQIDKLQHQKLVMETILEQIQGDIIKVITVDTSYEQ